MFRGVARGRFPMLGPGTIYYHLTYIDEPDAIQRMRDRLGVRNIMWSNDYPHFNMTFPHSRENVEYHLQGLDEAKRKLLTRDNAIKLFGLDH